MQDNALNDVVITSKVDNFWNLKKHFYNTTERLVERFICTQFDVCRIFPGRMLSLHFRPTETAW